MLWGGKVKPYSPTFFPKTNRWISGAKQRVYVVPTYARVRLITPSYLNYYALGVVRFPLRSLIIRNPHYARQQGKIFVAHGYSGTRGGPMAYVCGGRILPRQ